MSEEEWVEPRPNKAKRIFKEFADIPTTRFEKKHFRMLIKVLSEVYSEWEGIGMCLEIKENKMSNLGDKWKQQSNRGLISIVDEWMKGNYKEKGLYPCWKSVVYVVADGIGGRNPAAARVIAKNWKAVEDDPFFGCEVAKRADSSPLYQLDERTGFLRRLCSNYLNEVEQMWFEIGVLLGVPFNQLETIYKDKKHDKLLEVINVWIDLDLDYLPEPTMQVLVDAVAHMMGGNNQDLAKRIAESASPDIQPQSQPQQQQQQQQHQSQHQTSTQVHPAAPAVLPGSAVTGAAQAFNEEMTVDDLYSWLLRNKMPPEDCQLFKDKKMNGMSFGLSDEEEWKTFGISDSGLIILKKRIMKLVNPSSDMPVSNVPSSGHKNGSARNGSANSNGSTNDSSHGGRNNGGDMASWRTASSGGSGDDLSGYLSSLSDRARSHLNDPVDWNNDLIVIAHPMLDWEERLCTHLGLTDVDVHDIKAKHQNNPELQRREALTRWRNIRGLEATYGNLLELFVKARHPRCAEAVCNVLKE